MRTVRLAVVALLALAHCWAADKPTRVEPEVALRYLTKRVEPSIPPLAKQVEVGGMVVLEITVSAEGRVVSVKTVSGHPMLIGAFVDAVRQWEFKPLVVSGKPAAFTTRAEWQVPTPDRTNAENRALQDYYPLSNKCRELVQERKLGEAEEKCLQALYLSDQLPSNRILERSGARTFLAHALLLQDKIREAIVHYEKALEIDATRRDAEDADYASEHANLAFAYSLAGQLDKADSLYARSVTIFEAAIVALPSMKANYTRRLRTTLLRYAKLKAAMGAGDQAALLEKKAAMLESASEN